MSNLMKYKKIPLSKTILFLVFYWWVTPVYTIEPCLACCSSEEFFITFCKTFVEQLSLNTSEYHEDFHHCQCKQCEVHNVKETILLGTYTNKQEKQQNTSDSENITGLKVTPSNGTINSTSNTDFSKFHSLFLLTSTLLL